jgi:hypothetical protein
MVRVGEFVLRDLYCAISGIDLGSGVMSFFSSAEL